MCKNTSLLIIPNHKEHNNFAVADEGCENTVCVERINLINLIQLNQLTPTNDNISKRKN